MKWAQRVLVCRKCDAIRLYVFVYECSLFFLFIIWWSFNIMFSFFLRCSWHIITRICVQAKSYFCLKQSKNTFLLTNKKKKKNKLQQPYWMKTMRSLIIFIIFVHVCQWTFHHFEEFQEKKNRQATERKGSQKSNYCVVENDITVEQIRTVVYIYFDLRCCWHVTAAAAAACLLFFFLFGFVFSRFYWILLLVLYILDTTN